MVQNETRSYEQLLFRRKEKKVKKKPAPPTGLPYETITHFG